MTIDIAKQWVIHFQNRIILQKLPNPIYTFYMDILLRYTCEETCEYVNEKICDVIDYLKNHLPTICVKIPNTQTDTPLIDCKFYQLRISIYYVDPSVPPELAVGKFTIITLDETALIFKNKQYYININDLLKTNIPEEFWNDEKKLHIEVKYDFNSEWVDLYPLQSLQIV